MLLKPREGKKIDLNFEEALTNLRASSRGKTYRASVIFRYWA